ncbi:MAG: stress response translation initiation inhibitor YciH [Pseudomonadota bacterium]
MSNSRLVFSTLSGRVKETKAPESVPQGDGIIRIRREISGRKGKGVTTITGFLLQEAELKVLAKDLKQLCGTGGSVKNGVVEIQGDQREKIKTELESRGFVVKLAGG